MQTINFNLNKQEINFPINYTRNSTQWERKNKDAYSFQTLAGIPCFIKRAESRPAAWSMLEQLAQIPHKQPSNCPTIYHTATATEKKKKIYYYFSEKLEGKTVMQAITGGERIDLKKLLHDITAALHFLHQRGYWFSDLNEENIFKGTDGKYYLIDLDSCWLNKTKPNYDQFAKGGIPNKAQAFIKPIDQFYATILNKKNTFTSLSGANLNYLQIIFIVTKLNYFYSYPSIKYSELRNVDLHRHFHDKTPFNSRIIHENALIGPLDPKQITSFDKFLVPIIKKPNTITVKTPTSSVSKKSKSTKKVIQQKPTPPSTSSSSVSSILSWLTATILILCLGTGSYFGFYEYQFNKHLEQGDALYDKEAYKQALSVYEAAHDYKDDWNTIQTKTASVKQASLQFFKTQAPAIHTLISANKYKEAQTSTQSLKDARQYTRFLQDSIRTLEHKLEAYQSVDEANRLIKLNATEKGIKALKLLDSAYQLYPSPYIKQQKDTANIQLKQLHQQFKNSLLIAACLDSDYTSFKEALDKGGNPNTQTEEGVSLILLAIQNNRLDLVKLLGSKDVDCNNRTSCLTVNKDSLELGSPLVVAAWLGHLEIVKYLIEACGADINLQEKECNNEGLFSGWSPLAAAAAQGHSQIVIYLVGQNANLNIVQGKAKTTPLMEAAKANHFSIVKYLVEQGAKLKQKDSKEKNIYGYAKSKEIRRFLQQKGLGKYNYENTFNGAKTEFSKDFNKTGSMYIDKGNLIVKNIKQDKPYLKTTAFPYDITDDFSILTDFSFSKNTGKKNAAFGVVFGSDSKNKNFYLIQILASGQCKLYTHEGGKWEELKVFPKEISLQLKNDLQIKRSGKRISFYINNQSIGFKDIDQYFGNHIGFYAQGNMQAKIQNLRILGYKSSIN